MTRVVWEALGDNSDGVSGIEEAGNISAWPETMSTHGCN
jgi:hypothetical protein